MQKVFLWSISLLYSISFRHSSIELSLLFTSHAQPKSSFYQTNSTLAGRLVYLIWAYNFDEHLHFFVHNDMEMKRKTYILSTTEMTENQECLFHYIEMVKERRRGRRWECNLKFTLLLTFLINPLLEGGRRLRTVEINFKDV